MSQEAAEFQQAIDDLEDCYKRGLRTFVEWFAKEWQMSREGWVEAFADPPPSDDWFAGHNTGVESVLVALDSFLDEHRP